VFTGSSEDVKRMGSTALTGKLLASLLEECCLALNDNRLPQVKSMWDSIRECSDEQAFEALASDLRNEVARIALPLSKEELRVKLNDIQNRLYQRLEREYPEVDQFKRYHR
jgi:spore coat polysaccharide biosynthesis protein SpsF (cytidylyltransferase family)